MDKVQIFEHPLFGQLPIVVVEGKEYFGAMAVAKALGYSNTHDAINRHTRKEGVVFHEVLTSGGKQQKKFISEGNVYRLITNSKLPNAEQFEIWVFDEVLVSIRKHGAYMTPDTIDNIISDPDFGIKLLTSLKEEKDKRLQAERIAYQANQTIVEQKPKVLFADAITSSTTTILVGELAKILKQNGIDMGQTRLFNYLRDNGYLIKRKGTDYNMPTQKSMNLGLFEIKETPVMRSTGASISKTPKVTAKGQQYFINHFLAKGDTA